MNKEQEAQLDAGILAAVHPLRSKVVQIEEVLRQLFHQELYTPIGEDGEELAWRCHAGKGFLKHKAQTAISDAHLTKAPLSILLRVLLPGKESEASPLAILIRNLQELPPKGELEDIAEAEAECDKLLQELK